MPDIDTEISISQKQRMFIKAIQRGRIYWGGIRSGKTYVICINSILDALNGLPTAIISFSYHNLFDVVWRTFERVLPMWQFEPEEDYHFVKSGPDGGTLTIRGVPIFLRSGDNPDSLRGLSLGSWYIDECREFPDRTIFDVMLGRLSLGGDQAHWGLCSSAKGKNWLWQLVHDQGLEEGLTSGFATTGRITLVFQKTSENPFLGQEYLSEINELYVGKLKAQELEGEVVEWSAGVFKPEWFQNKEEYWRPETGVRFWDLAASTKSYSDYSVGVLMSKKLGITCVVDVVRMKTLNLHELIIETALKDGPGIIVGIEATNMQNQIAGGVLADPRMAGHKVVPHKHASSDKFNRALPMVSRFEAGTLRICKGAWNQDYIDEFCTYTPIDDEHGHDDQVDASSDAWYLINKQPIIRQCSCMPAPEDVDETKIITYSAVEILDYKAYCVKARYHTYEDWIEIESELVASTVVKAITDYLKPAKHRLGSEELDGPSLKSLYMTFTKNGCNVLTEKLDADGAVAALNSMIMAGHLYSREGLRTWTELMSADKDFTPLVKCVLHIVQHVYNTKPAPVKEYAPFEKKRIEFRRKLAEKDKPKELKSWV